MFIYKKSLGQNFLKSKSAVNTIILASKLKSDDVVLEIGPGEGVMTEELLKLAKKVVVVEKDDRLVPFLKEKFKENIESRKLKLIHGDILDLDMSKSLFDIEKAPENRINYKLIANIPYYITGQILRKFLESENQPESMTLMVQKEVAERIVAKDNKESLLSLSVKIFGDPKYIKTIKKSEFRPAPKVDSAILNIENINRNKLSEFGIEIFFELIHVAFSHKRKQLLSNLSLVYPKNKLEKLFKSLEIDLKARAEDIDLETWIKFCNKILE